MADDGSIYVHLDTTQKNAYLSSGYKFRDSNLQAIVSSENQLEFSRIMELIKKYQIPGTFRKEKEVQMSLASYLEGKLEEEGYKVKREYQRERARVDLFINRKENSYALEVKVPRNRGELQKAYGELNDYKKVFSNVGLILVDVGEYPSERLKSWCDEDIKDMGIPYVIIHGTLSYSRKASRRGIYYNIRRR